MYDRPICILEPILDTWHVAVWLKGKRVEDHEFATVDTGHGLQDFYSARETAEAFIAWRESGPGRFVCEHALREAEHRYVAISFARLFAIAFTLGAASALMLCVCFHVIK